MCMKSNYQMDQRLTFQNSFWTVKFASFVLVLLTVTTQICSADKPSDPNGREKTATSSLPPTPKVKILFDYPVRDTSICLGGDGCYYLTGTTGHPTWWKTNEGIRLWQSKDLLNWKPMGSIWTFEKDGTWQKKFGKEGKRAIWGPEIHYIKGTYWIAYCVNYEGTGILKSISGKAEGPYIDIKPDGPLTTEIDASLFVDDDGSVYFLYQSGKIAKMKDDMSGLSEEPKVLRPSNNKHVGFEVPFYSNETASIF